MTITAEAMPILRDAGVDIEAAIHAGDRVTIRVRSGNSLQNGQEYCEKAGRAAMHGSAGWVLNMAPGTPICVCSMRTAPARARPAAT
jgi:hypothetical protein